MKSARLSLFRRQSNANAIPTTRGTVARVPNRRGEGPIEPMEDVEGAENNLGLDDIPQGLGSGMDLCWLDVADEIGGRSWMSGGGGGPRALRASGKACNGNKRIGYKASLVYSSGNWTRERHDATRDANLRAHYVWLCLCCVVSSRRVALIVSNQPRVHLPSRGAAR